MANTTEIVENVSSIEIISSTTSAVETLSTSDTVVEVLVPGPIGPQPSVPAAITYLFDGCDAPIPVGQKGSISIPFNCVINSWTLLCSPSGSITVDVLKSTYAGFPGSNASITGGARPQISGGQEATSSSLGAWTTALSPGDILTFSVISIATVTLASLNLSVTRT